jgi:hypothetical protein
VQKTYTGEGNSTALHEAAEKGETVEVEKLLVAGFPVDATNKVRPSSIM